MALGGSRPAAVRERGSRPVGPGHGGRLGRRRRAAGRDRGRGRAADDLSHRERAGGAAGAGPPAGADPPALSRGDAAARRPDRGRGAPHRGLHPAGAAARQRRSAYPAPAAGPRCRPCWTRPDFTLASFLLSVLGEGTFLDLLRFLHTHAPDPVTASITRLVLQDESRHVAFGVAHTAQGGRRRSDACWAGCAAPSNAGIRRCWTPPG